VQLAAHPFVACFSLHGDLLSQWRAYADDGRGFAIGFHSRSLKQQLPATFLRVLYDKEQQVKEMMAAIVAIYLRQSAPEESSKRVFEEDCALLRLFMTSFKHPSFAEEQEVRAVHALKIRRHGKLMKFVDDGGKVNGDIEVLGGDVSFQVRDNHLVAYTDVALAPASMNSPVRQVVFGPKNHSAITNLYLFLGGLGYADIGCIKSMSPYR
jgi:hypothetical protein